QESTDSPDRDRRANEAIAAYLGAVDAGRAPDRRQWLARYPDLAAELEVFLTDHDRVDRLAQPLRPPSPAPPGGTAPAGEGTGADLPGAATPPPEDGNTGAYPAAQPAALASAATPAAGPPLGTKVR